ncbi:ABC-2 type transport system ATP-binding protein [Amycolatopsis tolypomycina]|uniref:ABC-2 type transport system ATP-binding protein n=1 Tax=Amycolatopsis tolypomycina TaxID=208445 RepID=A0A1H5CVJ8_9PSEU|nr:ABC transporter ATP-binding protein [Amycolatopsis tolypomycina]SED70438.1 ABC-2 type transport system ATP-binding protein [Amycolatopsis tolypomycina]
MTTAVSVRGLRKQYPGHLAVAGLDLEIAQGEVFALLGPNGAGKTTTVEILEGHRQRTAGEVTVLGEDPGKAGRAWRARLGIVLQTATDAAELNVAETVRHFAKYYPGPRDPDEVIEKVGLTEKARTRVKALSGGQRRRVDVALGIIGRPELLFLDEPTTGFDPEARRQFWTLISDLAAEGTTILLTTHYLDEAEALADRVAVIARGEIVAQDTPQNLGGRAAAEATVRWTDERGEHVERTAYPTKLVTELAAGGRELAGLTVTRPSLEDIYLDLIGDKA